MASLLVTHPSFVNHLTGPSHPERPDRMRAIDKVLSHDSFDDLVREEAPLRDDVQKQILLAHPQAHFDLVEKAQPSGEGKLVHLDSDTVASGGSWEAAIRAVGAGLLAVDKVMDKSASIQNAFCQVRPPGHHAEAQRAMGFCFFSNAAIAAYYARAKYGAERVAVVDFDVHHGNGTQDIFWSDPNAFYASSHQMPLFPGTGALSETGVGNIFNAPLEAGDGGDEFKEAYETRILPALKAFNPDLIVVSAGFDAHVNDPLANLELVEADFGWITRQLCEAADKLCDGRLVSMLEGGYDLTGLAKSVGVHVRTLMDHAG